MLQPTALAEGGTASSLVKERVETTAEEICRKDECSCGQGTLCLGRLLAVRGAVPMKKVGTPQRSLIFIFSARVLYRR